MDPDAAAAMEKHSPQRNEAKPMRVLTEATRQVDYLCMSSLVGIDGNRDRFCYAAVALPVFDYATRHGSKS